MLSFPSRCARVTACVIAVFLVGLLLQCAIASPRPTTGPATGGTTSDHFVTVDGLERVYHLYIPDGLIGPAPLVVMFHGGYGSGLQAEKSYGWNAVADQAKFVVAYPDGLDRSWNAGDGCCGASGASGIDDVDFIERMVSEVVGANTVDRTRIYAAGISNGAIMSYRLACETSVFAAVGIVAGTVLVDCAPPRPISVIHIHGIDDQTVPYDGGPGTAYGRNGANIDGPSVPAVNELWRTIDDCASTQIRTAGPITTTTAACPAGRDVEMISIAAAGHQWPGSSPHPLLARSMGTDPPTTNLDATTTLWTFFSKH